MEDDPEESLDRQPPTPQVGPSPHPIATLVAAAAAYEVVAVTVNTSLDDRVLPSMTGLLQRIRWSGVLRVSLLGAWWAGCWTVLGLGIGTIALRSRRSR